MRTLGIILIVSLLLIPAMFVRAQDAGYQFENVSARLGQLHTIIHEIYQDETGFLWFATQSGLHRYDGYELMSFRHDVYDTTSLANPVVWHVTSDVSGRIWASTPYGLSVMDPVSREFKRYLPFPDEISNKQVNFIRKVVLAGRDDIIVAGYNRLFRFNAASGEFTPLRTPKATTRRLLCAAHFVARTEQYGWVWPMGLCRTLPVIQRSHTTEFQKNKKRSIALWSMQSTARELNGCYWAPARD